MTAEAHGPIDFVLLEFPGDRLTGRAAREVLDLVDRGTIALYDVSVVGRTDEGEVYSVDLAESAGRLGDFAGLTWARSGLLTDDDVAEAAETLRPGTLAALLVYENTWAIPFVAAAREAGGELVAAARIPAQDVMDALDALEATETHDVTI